MVAAAGYQDDVDNFSFDGRTTPIVAATNYIGHEEPPMTDGRAPIAVHEIALGSTTARVLHKHIGDDVILRNNTDSKVRVRLRVVGIAVVNDPITNQSGAGDGVVVTPGLVAETLGPGNISQSIVIKLDPRRDRAAAIESVRRDFSGSIREATPQVDVRNLGHLRAVPWLISALIAILALATLVHALVTIVARNRTNLAVLAALGLTRGQRRAVGCVRERGTRVRGDRRRDSLRADRRERDLAGRDPTERLARTPGRGVVDARCRADRRARDRGCRRAPGGARNIADDPERATPGRVSRPASERDDVAGAGRALAGSTSSQTSRSASGAVVLDHVDPALDDRREALPRVAEPAVELLAAPVAGALVDLVGREEEGRLRDR